SAYCPANTFKASTTVCRSVAGVCDVAETCTGTSAYCPANTYKASATVCRAAAGVCDVAESCTGTSPYCPANGFQPSGTACDDGNATTCNDQCTAGACAGSPRPGSGCVLVLDPSADLAFAVGGSAIVNAPTCSIYVNSTST